MTRTLDLVQARLLTSLEGTTARLEVNCEREYGKATPKSNFSLLEARGGAFKTEALAHFRQL